MKLYIIDKRTKEKAFLRVIAPNKAELSKTIGGRVFFVNGNAYSVDEVKAEPTTDSAAVGGLLGGFIGAAGGAGGVVLGGLLGALIGQTQADKDQKEAERFNGSRA